MLPRAPFVRVHVWPMSGLSGDSSGTRGKRWSPVVPGATVAHVTEPPPALTGMNRGAPLFPEGGGRT